MAMLGFFTFGSMLAFLDLAAKNQIEAQDKDEFPKELKGTKGKIWLYKNHNPGLSFGVLKECPKAMELVPLCITSAFGGAWTYILGKRGCFFEKLAATLVMAGGVSNLYDRMRRGPRCGLSLPSLEGVKKKWYLTLGIFLSLRDRSF